MIIGYNILPYIKTGEFSYRKEKKERKIETKDKDNNSNARRLPAFWSSLPHLPVSYTCTSFSCLF